jgi:hypothetical protein
MAEYEKDTHFSWGWMLGGAAIMLIVRWFALFVAVGTGVQELWALAAIVSGTYLIGGFVIGWQSEGRTILEAGLAALISMGTYYLAIAGIAAITAPVIAAALLGVPFGTAILGAWLGEKVQGDVIYTKDD